MVHLGAIDKHIDQYAPWTIKDKTKLKEALQKEIDDLRNVALKLQPFLPDTAKKILDQFKGPTIKAAAPLFPRIT
jgi:methionyl-tRNA synthetase